MNPSTEREHGALAQAAAPSFPKAGAPEDATRCGRVMAEAIARRFAH